MVRARARTRSRRRRKSAKRKPRRKSTARKRKPRRKSTVRKRKSVKRRVRRRTPATPRKRIKKKRSTRGKLHYPTTGNPVASSRPLKNGRLSARYAHNVLDYKVGSCYEIQPGVSKRLARRSGKVGTYHAWGAACANGMQM